jgi:RNA recognition motif. (a.k.a. RRM, RBD, or RNP domain)
MHQYLQQCLDFHESQELQRKCESDQSVRQVQFVKSADVLNESFPNKSHEAPATEDPTAVHVPLLSESAPQAFERSVEEGRCRVQAILDRFRQQQQNLLMFSGGGDSALAPDSSAQDQELPECDSFHALHQLPQGIPETIQVHAPSASAHGACYPSAALFVEQRTKGLQREALHKHRFLLRNLEYVARREQQRAQILADSIDASKLREAHVQDQYSLALLERQRLLRESAIIANTSKAAIGSRPRRDVERMKRKAYEHGSADINNEPDLTPPSVALYLSGLPVDGTVDETFLRRLFEPYGSIQKVHVYRDKTNGQLKGDALIVYQPSNDAGNVNLLSDVCSQVRKWFTTLS